MAQGSRRTRLVGSKSLSNGGPTPTDLTKSVEVSQPTLRRLIEGKAAKGRGKTQSSISQTEVSMEGELRVTNYATLHKFYKLYEEAADERIRTDIWKTITKIKKIFGLESDDDDA